MAAAKDKNANLKLSLPELDLRTIAEIQALHSQLLATNFPVRLPSINPLGLNKLRDALTARKRRMEKSRASVARGNETFGAENSKIFVNERCSSEGDRLSVAKTTENNIAQSEKSPVDMVFKMAPPAAVENVDFANSLNISISKNRQVPVAMDIESSVAKVNSSADEKADKVNCPAEKTMSSGEDNAEDMTDSEYRNRSVSDSAIFRLQKPFFGAKDCDQLQEERFGLNPGTPAEQTNHLEASANGPGEPPGFFECPKMILCANKPSVVTWTSTPMKKNDAMNGAACPEDSLAKLSEASGSQSSSPAQHSNSDGGLLSAEKESDSSRLAFGCEVSLPCPLSGCDNIASEEKQIAQNNLVEGDTTENSNDGARPIGRPPKLARCKLCHLEFLGKENLWKHLGEAHFKENALRCEFCPFVTRYRHHFEYHLRNHFGEKPYRCDKCEYKCVNKSMLASHQKSHTNIYQYKCDTCGYASKYYHSMKQHIDKTQHKLSAQQPSCSPRPSNGPLPSAPDTSPPAMPPVPGNFNFPSNVVLPIGMQGVPILNGVNLISPPQPPRPPLLAPRVPDPAQPISAPAQLMPGASLPPPMFLNAATNPSDFPVISRHAPGLAGPLGTPLAFQQFQNALSLFALDQNQIAACPEPGQAHPATTEMSDPMPARMVPPPLLTCPQLIKKELQKSMAMEEEEEEKEEAEEEEGSKRFEEVMEEKRGESLMEEDNTAENASAILAKLHYCKHCEIYFKNAVTFQCHVGCHNFDEPFKCNRCGYKASDPITFMNHHMCSQL